MGLLGQAVTVFNCGSQWYITVSMSRLVLGLFNFSGFEVWNLPSFICWTVEPWRQRLQADPGQKPTSSLRLGGDFRQGLFLS